jgi:hypothetical protein
MVFPCFHRSEFKKIAGVNDSMSEINAIIKRMKALEILIQETRDRLPAHSTKPPVMMELLDYEDEYAALAKQLQSIRTKR